MACLAEIIDYIRQDSPLRAETTGRRLFDSANKLATFPYAGRMVPEWGRPDLREIIVAKYRVMYHVSPGVVTIFRVVHSRLSVGYPPLPDVDLQVP